jgi:hypothetical protein
LILPSGHGDYQQRLASGRLLGTEVEYRESSAVEFLVKEALVMTLHDLGCISATWSAEMVDQSILTTREE